MYFFLDEYGTMPAFPDAEAMFRRAEAETFCRFPIIQSLSQLEENYGRYGAETIKECCQNIIFGGLSPLSPAAEELSKSLGNQTVLSGSVSTGSSSGSGRKGSNQSLQMIARPLMTPDENTNAAYGRMDIFKNQKSPYAHHAKAVFRLEYYIKSAFPYSFPAFKAYSVCKPRDANRLGSPTVYDP